MCVHVDDGLTNITVDETPVRRSHGAKCGTTRAVERPIFFLDRVIVTTARGQSVEANSRYTRDVTALVGLEGARPVSTEGQENTNDRVLGRAGKRETSDAHHSCGEAVVHVPSTKRHHVQRERDSTKDLESQRERRDKHEAQHTIPERCHKRQVPN